MFTLSPDVALPSFLFWLGATGPLGLGVAALVVLVEAAVLKRLQWGTWGRVLLVAMVMNVASTVAGLLLGRLPLDFALLIMVGLFSLSVLIEWGVLHAFRPQAGRANLVAAFWANLASYIPLTLLLILLLFRG